MAAVIFLLDEAGLLFCDLKDFADLGMRQQCSASFLGFINLPSPTLHVDQNEGHA